MKYHNPFFLLTLVMSMVACKPHDPCQDQDPAKHTEYKLNADEVSKIPYTGTDTLVFVSDGGDTATLYGQGKKQYMLKTSTNRNTDPGCPFYDYQYYESIECDYNGNNEALKNIYCTYYTTGTAEYHEVYSGSTNLGLSGFSYVNKESVYDTDVIIDGTTFKALAISPGASDTPKIVFYNYHYGILKLKMPNGNEWVRQL